MATRRKAARREKGKARRKRRAAPDVASTEAGSTGARGGATNGTRRGPLAWALKKRNPLAHVAQAAALIGLIGSIVGLVFVFKPDWKPQPTPDVGTLKVSEVSIRRPVTFRRYLERVKVSPADLTKAYLSRRGVLIEFGYEAAGLRGKGLPIQWELVDAKTHERVAADGQLGNDETGNDAVAIEPSKNQETAKWFVWVPAPPPGRSYYVTVTIYQPPKGEVDVPLDDFDTPEFRGFT